jgi:hypothetical protein
MTEKEEYDFFCKNYGELDEENRDKLLTVGKKLLEIKRMVSNTENKIDIPESQIKVEKL